MHPFTVGAEKGEANSSTRAPTKEVAGEEESNSSTGAARKVWPASILKVVV